MNTNEIAHAAKIIARGGVVVFPTDTLSRSCGGDRG